MLLVMLQPFAAFGDCGNVTCGDPPEAIDRLIQFLELWRDQIRMRIPGALQAILARNKKKAAVRHTMNHPAER